MKTKILLILLIFISIFLEAQNFSEQNGVPFIMNFTPSDYDAHEQNFAIDQDSNGVMYFANFEAVLIYDGARWRKVPTKSGMRVLSLDATDSIVYVAGLYDFGFIEKNKFGQYVYHSLVDTNYNPNDIGLVFKVIVYADKVFFFTNKKMFIYDGNKIDVVKFDNNLIEAHKVNNRLFLFFERKLNRPDLLQNGLVVYDNAKFVPVFDKTIEQIVDVKGIFYLSSRNFYVIGTESQGFFILKNDTIEQMDVHVNDFVKSHPLTTAVRISDDLYAIGTFSNGVLFVNNKGEIIQVVDKKTSLADQSINALFVDKSGDLWLATNNGISVMEINNALSLISNNVSGIEGKINKIGRFNGEIYVASDNGLYFLKDNIFQKVKDFNLACFDILQTGKKLWIATPMGVFAYNGNKIEKTDVNDFAFCFLKTSANNILIGHNSYVTVANIIKGQLNIIDTLTGFSGNVVKMLEDRNKTVFAEVTPGKIYYFHNDKKNIAKIKTGENFISLHPCILNGEVFFATEKGVFAFDESKDTLVNYDFFSNIDTTGFWIYDFYKIMDNHFVFTDGSRKNTAEMQILNGQISVYRNNFSPIADFLVRTFYYDKKYNNLWIGGNNGIVLFNFNENKLHKQYFPVYITKIINIRNDSLLVIDKKDNKFQFAENSIGFEFATPYYPAEQKILYSYFLEGYENEFRSWTTQTYKEYPNLPAGTYIFHVKAKDQFGNPIPEDTFEFKIYPPLYRRWWVILFYLIFVAAIVKFIIDRQLKKAEKERKKLEKIIKERTAEIEQSKAEIEAQRDIEYKQRKEIMDSIHYAKRIQSAVLPDFEFMENIFGENYFVLFRPYNVVSGDFFWMKKIKNFIVVVAADCTGHGVPGAFMSMLGTSFLNEIVTRRSLDSAATVLDRLRNKVKTSLHQQGKSNEQKDGMDIALYYLDTEAHEIQFAGAYNPLYIVRNNSLIDEEFLKFAADNKKIKIFTDQYSSNEHTLIELKADRQPIGIYIKERPFTNISVKLQNGDAIYSFSDGYQDQFGGDIGEKFSAKRLRKLLLSIQDKTMQEQKSILEQNFLKWKGDREQIDDVLIMGIKVFF